jgi:chromosome segregation ATPase
MEQIIQGIMERLQAAVKLCDLIALSVPEVSPVITDVRQRLELLLEANTSMLFADEERTTELREKVADLRHEIHQCTSKLESLKTPVTDSYRSLLGSDKAQFESLDDAAQQQANPSAYSARQAFHSISRLEDVFSLISADLMNLNGELEHQALQSRSRPDTTRPDTTTYDAHDNVPAPPSLSP